MRTSFVLPHAALLAALVSCSSQTPSDDDAGRAGTNAAGASAGNGMTAAGGSVAAGGSTLGGGTGGGGTGAGGAGSGNGGTTASGGTAGGAAAGGSAGNDGGGAGSTSASGGMGGVGGVPSESGGVGGLAMAGQSGDAGSAGAPGGAGGGSGLHGGASGKYVCTPGATYGNPLTGMGSVGTIGPPTTGQPNYFAFVEGPVWVASLGRLFFSDNVSPERIWTVTPGGTPSVFEEMSNSNGLALDNDDQLIVTDQEMNRITRLDPTASTPTQVLIGAAMCKPNDVVVRSDGNLYYTAPQQAGTGFYRMTADGTVTGPRTDVGAPNGIVLSPDETILYVGDVNNKQIAKFSLAADGTIGATATPFVTAMNSTVDGMCVDCAGNVYAATSNGVEVFAPDGSPLGIIPTGEASNCTFGGSDRKTLFATSRSVLKTVTLAVPGLPD